MSIYESGFGFGFDFEKRKALPIIGAILALIVVVLIVFMAFDNFSFSISPLGLRFEKNPVKPGEQTKVFVAVSNNTEQDARNVLLSLTAKENTEFDIYALNEKFDGSIKVLSKGTSREITFLINPIGEILPGTYTLVAQTTINGRISEQETTLVVQN